MKKILLVSCLLCLPGLVFAASISDSEAKDPKFNKALALESANAEKNNVCSYEEKTYQQGAIKQIGDRYIYCVDLNKKKSHWSNQQKMGWIDEGMYKKEYQQ